MKSKKFLSAEEKLFNRYPFKTGIIKGESFEIIPSNKPLTTDMFGTEIAQNDYHILKSLYRNHVKNDPEKECPTFKSWIDRDILLADALDENKNITKLYLRLFKTKNKELPKEIIGLNHLEHLGILDCNFESYKALNEMKNIKQLLLMNTHVETMPLEIGDMFSLEELIIWNQKNKTFLEDVSNLTNLTTVDLSFNTFKKCTPDIVYDIPNLKHLKLASTSGTSLSKKIQNAVNLESLNLETTRIERLPNSIKKLKLLKDIYLNKSQLYKHLLDEEFANINYTNKSDENKGDRKKYGTPMFEGMLPRKHAMLELTKISSLATIHPKKLADKFKKLHNLREYL